jgi:GNAT superfamily N-acetyltransferase
MNDLFVRAVRPDEWERLRDFRLEALRDEVAPIAFLTTFEEAAAQPDELWQTRARAGSESAGTDARQRTIIAAEGVRWCGTLTVLVTEAGETDFTGKVLADQTANVVSVYVSPGARGSGAIQALLDAAADWASAQGLAQLQLFVHEQNGRAQRAYEKSGFVFAGPSPGEHDELKMVRST